MKTFKLNKKNLVLYNEKVKSNYVHIKNMDIYKCVDPDKYIIQPFGVNEEEILLSPDGICGIKYLIKYYKKQDVYNAYSAIRRKIIMWPKCQQGINQRRYSFFRDRLDFTIFDIKNFYEYGNSKLVKEGSVSARFLTSLGGFKDFIEEYELENFVEKGEVINLELGNGTVISNYEEYGFSEEKNERYLGNLLKRL